LITVTTNQNVIIDPNGSGHIYTDAPIESVNATASTTKATGAITTGGGIGASGQIFAAGLNVTPTSTLKFSAQDQYMLVPNGTTAQRPTGATGYTRYNTDLNILEFYNGTTWIGCGFRDVDVTGARTSAAFETNWCNTASSAYTVTLPSSPAKGMRVRFFDVAKTFDSNNLTVGRNGQPIQGDNANLTVNSEGAAFELCYYNSTYGWRIFTI
tara:strand:+ start:436 stop:1071 length:636 start_codon:yes stop_codon:yes gene_type:complete